MSAVSLEAGKRAAGRAALDEVRSGMTLGLGTGSTVRHFLEALGAALAAGDLANVRGIPTSRDTEARCHELGIPLVGLEQAERIDVAVDGADEVDPDLELIKGLGGALLREKMVVQAADRFVVVVDPSKRVIRLGQRSPLPVEVVPFGWRAHEPFFRSLGAEPRLRMTATDDSYRTDNGNLIVDLGFPDGIPDAAELEAVLARRAGVVETGLFLGVADRVLIGDPHGLESIARGET